MRSSYCIWTLLLLLAIPAAAQQTERSAGSTGYTVFVQGKAIGREEVTIRSDSTGTVISSQGRIGAPLNSQLRRGEIRYRADETPESFEVDATVNGGSVTIRTTFTDGTAVTEGSQAGTRISASHKVSPRAILLPNGIFGGMAALAKRIVNATVGMEIRSYIVPNAEGSVRISGINRIRMQSGTVVFNARRYDLISTTAAGDQPFTVIAGEDGSLMRVTIPSQAIDVVRDDLASSTSRTEVFSNPGDEAVIIPTSGFNIGATMTRPTAPRPETRLPAVILLGGSAVADRDGVEAGIPTLAQLAGAIADAGFLTIRYDKRGFGQSGGRAESAGIPDYADDARAVANWLANRKDVDPKRIAIVGHDDGAWVALLAAARDKRLAAVVSLAGPASTGADLLLEQQQYALEQQKAPEVERAAKISLQQRIHSAVLTGKGWEGIPADVRRQAETPWLQSLLAYNPAKVMSDVRQPVLVVHGALDRHVAVAHADKLADLARTQSKSKSVEMVIVRGVNHLLVPAFTGDPSEYATLPDRNVSTEVTTAVASWLTKTLPSAGSR